MRWAYLLILFGSTLSASAQFGFRVLGAFPTGQLGFLAKPAISIEGGFLPTFNERRERINVAVSYLRFEPRQDTFRAYSATYNSRWVVEALDEVYKPIAMIQVAGGLDYDLIYDDRLHGFVGLDAMTGLFKLNYIEYTAIGVRNRHEGWTGYGGLRPKIGIEYDVHERVSVFGSICRSYMLAPDIAFITANDFGVGARFTFF